MVIRRFAEVLLGMVSSTRDIMTGPRRWIGLGLGGRSGVMSVMSVRCRAGWNIMMGRSVLCRSRVGFALLLLRTVFYRVAGISMVEVA